MPTNDMTSFYYSFSTISQTFAAIIALLASFVLYRFQTIYTEIDKEVDLMLTYYAGLKDDSPIHGNEKRELTTSAKRWAVTKIAPKDYRQPWHSVALPSVKRLYDYKINIEESWKLAIIVSAISILGSILMLLFSDILSPYRNICFVFGFFASVACFFTYYNLLRLCLTDMHEAQK